MKPRCLYLAIFLPSFEPTLNRYWLRRAHVLQVEGRTTTGYEQRGWWNRLVDQAETQDAGRRKAAKVRTLLPPDPSPCQMGLLGYPSVDPPARSGPGGGWVLLLALKKQGVHSTKSSGCRVHKHEGLRPEDKSARVRRPPPGTSCFWMKRQRNPVSLVFAMLCAVRGKGIRTRR